MKFGHYLLPVGLILVASVGSATGFQPGSTPNPLPGPSSGRSSNPSAQLAPQLTGSVPSFYFPDVQWKSSLIWNTIRERFDLPTETAPPRLHFEAFVRDSQDPEWSSWRKNWIQTHFEIWQDWVKLKKLDKQIQVTRERVDANMETIFPFPATFLAFHFDGTNRIQLDPARTFLNSVGTDPYGVRRAIGDQGYYTIAHEMLHYALELRGVTPTRLHHCQFTLRLGQRPSLMQSLTQNLIRDNALSEMAAQRGQRSEESFHSCEALTESERTLALNQLERLASEETPISP